MEDEKPPVTIDREPLKFPDGYRFPEDSLRKWVDIPYDEELIIGPLSKSNLDQLLFSTTDMARSIMALRGALVLFSNGNLEQANICLDNCQNAVTDAETRNRILYGAIMESALKVRDGTKR
ncbi:hypothetical protein ONR75_15710 [Rhodopseudomonas sp. P2A-2r]|uniref:hypothetical protein n=1 Tax=Rhodopseudomonas sp. P2A-2r TaxID=2991972 RepID=UPI0022344B19|nr:hypothetical protein [Rhodopseudomonas sp. P2A-2r]UZE51879.1 hypothetical protein ONR75_15710 [Rhodopseudomonas sp. P2A-2r]